MADAADDLWGSDSIDPIETDVEESDVDGEGSQASGEAKTADDAGESTEETKQDGEAETPSVSGDKETVPLATHLKLKEKFKEAKEQLSRAEGFQEGVRAGQRSTEEPGPEEEEQSLEDRFWENPVEVIKQVSAQSTLAARKQFVEIEAERLAREHEDFEPAVSTFAEAAQKDPVLQQQYNAAKNPAAFAYQHGKMLQELGSYTSPEEYYKSVREKVINEVTPQIEAELRKKLNLESDSEIQPSHAGARTAGGAGGSEVRALPESDYWPMG